MKKLLIALSLIAIFFTTNAQERHVKFFSPVPHDLLTQTVDGLRSIENPSVWLLRPMATITAIQLNYNKVTKKFDASALSSAGLGVSYAHFVEAEGLPVQNFGVNALILIGADIENVTQSSLLFALTGSFQFIQAGLDYNFASKKLGILTGIAIKF